MDGEAGDELPIMVHVTAPASLPAGYTFEAEINGDPDKVFTCDVVRLKCIAFALVINWGGIGWDV